MTIIIAERRYALLSSSVPNILDSLDGLGLGETKFPQSHNHTVYFDTDNPAKRVRRYADSPLRIREYLGYDEKWFYETKQNESIGGGWVMTIKRRQENTDLTDAVRKADAPLVTATSYKRRHFVENEQEDAVRVTLDSDIRFYRITDSSTAKFTGTVGKEGAIVEIKSPPKKASSPLSMAIQRLLRGAGAANSESKRSRALRSADAATKSPG